MTSDGEDTRWAATLSDLLAADAREQQGDRPEGHRAVVDVFASRLDAGRAAHLGDLRHLPATRPDTRGRDEVDVGYVPSASGLAAS